MNRIILLLFIFLASGYSRDEVVILSPRVGTIIDIHENRFYRIFPKVKKFYSAQIYSTSDLNYKVRIIVTRKGKQKTYEKKMSLEQFTRFQNKVNAQPEFTKQAREIMYAGMDFLRASQIISDLQKPQYVKIIHNGNKRLRGTLVSFENNIVNVQTGRSLEKIDLDNVELISYRLSDNEFLGIKPYIYALSGAVGLHVAALYNSQRNPRLDESWYYRFYGITLGLIFSGELYDALTTMLTPTETFILSREKYEQNKRL
tara:strand:- start:301 stop:1074 length:774 start_codon:yes stop_codon:yes gene_type:complete